MIWRALPSDAYTLTRVAHAAKRHWKYPEDWIRLSEEFYLKMGARRVGELAPAPRGRTLPLLVLEVSGR
mgnify:FL=1